MKFGQTVMGKVQILRQGLYYRILCSCRVPGDAVCRLMVHSEEISENLGVLVPEKGKYVLDKKIPVKRMGKASPEFCLMPKREHASGRFIALSPEEPFRYIERLKDAYLVEQNGQKGILIQEKQGT